MKGVRFLVRIKPKSEEESAEADISQGVDGKKKEECRVLLRKRGAAAKRGGGCSSHKGDLSFSREGDSPVEPNAGGGERSGRMYHRGRG